MIITFVLLKNPINTENIFSLVSISMNLSKLAKKNYENFL